MSFQSWRRAMALVLSLCMLLAYIPVAQAEELAITKQPSNVTVAEGATAKTSVTATGDGLKYQWYYANRGSSTFKKASITSATYSVVMDSSRAGRQIYCVVTDSADNKVKSSTVTLNMAAALKITQQPTDVTVASGKTAKVSVTATGEGLKYQWYYANKGSSTFKKASITSATYSVVMDSSRAGRRIYCVVTDKYGSKATSKTVTLNMAAALKITKQPTDVTVASGKTASVSVTATGDGLKYQWYYANKGSSTFKKASFTTATYSVEMASSRAGRRIYCVVTDKYGNKVQSNTVTLKMASTLKITKQPVDVTVLKGKTAKVTVTATGDGLKYQWYYKNLTDTAFSKAKIKTSSYSVTMDDSRDGRQLYCVVTDSTGASVTSDTVTIAMPWPIRITQQPTDVEIYEGMTAETKVVADGDGLKYTWYSANKGSSTFKKASITGDTYAVEMTSARDGRRIYCVVSDKYGQKVKTDVVTLTMLDADEVPEGLKYSISNGAVTITDYTGSATKLVIPAKIEGYPVTVIGNWAFSQCGSLTSISLPGSVTYIQDYAFYWCRKLTGIVISSGTTSIGKDAFSSCTSLISIEVPSTVTSIGEDAFIFCQRLATIKVKNKSYAHRWFLDNGFSDKIEFY